MQRTVARRPPVEQRRHEQRAGSRRGRPARTISRSAAELRVRSEDKHRLGGEDGAAGAAWRAGRLVLDWPSIGASTVKRYWAAVEQIGKVVSLPGMASSLLLFAAAAALTASAAASCGRSDDVPCLRIPPCGGGAPAAAAAPFYARRVDRCSPRRNKGPFATRRRASASCTRASTRTSSRRGRAATTPSSSARPPSSSSRRPSSATDDPIWYHEIDGGPPTSSGGRLEQLEGQRDDVRRRRRRRVRRRHAELQRRADVPVGARLRATIANTSTGWKETLDVPSPPPGVLRRPRPLAALARQLLPLRVPARARRDFSNYQLGLVADARRSSTRRAASASRCSSTAATRRSPSPTAGGRGGAAEPRRGAAANRRRRGRRADAGVGPPTGRGGPAQSPPQDFGQWPLGVF